MVLFAFLTLLSFFHFVSVISSVLLQLLYTQISVYYGTPFLKEVDRAELLNFLNSSTVKKIFTDRFEVSAGIFLSSTVISFVFIVLLIAALFFSGLPALVKAAEGNYSGEVYHLLVKFLLIFLLIFSILSVYFYVYPAAFGYAMTKESFGSAFFAFFKVLSPSLWIKTLSFRYFLFLTGSGILFIVFALIGTLLLFTVVFFPVGVFFIYFVNVFFGTIAAESYKIAFKDELQSQS